MHKSCLDRVRMSWHSLDRSWHNRFPDLATRYVVTECGGGGDCQFHAIRAALASIGLEYPVWLLRRIAAMEFYGDEKLDTVDVWRGQNEAKDDIVSPPPAMLRAQAAEQMMQLGPLWQGDQFTLTMLSRALSINFVLFVENASGEDYVYLTSTRSDFYWVALLYQRAKHHYQLIGRLSSNKVIDCVWRCLPAELKRFS